MALGIDDDSQKEIPEGVFSFGLEDVDYHDICLVSSIGSTSVLNVHANATEHICSILLFIGRNHCWRNAFTGLLHLKLLWMTMFCLTGLVTRSSEQVADRPISSRDASRVHKHTSNTPKMRWYGMRRSIETPRIGES